MTSLKIKRSLKMKDLESQGLVYCIEFTVVGLVSFLCTCV